MIILGKRHKLAFPRKPEEHGHPIMMLETSLRRKTGQRIKAAHRR